MTLTKDIIYVAMQHNLRIIFYKRRNNERIEQTFFAIFFNLICVESDFSEVVALC